MASTASPRRSVVWKHFRKIDNNYAMCDLCGEKIACKGGSTSGTKNHLMMRHPPNPVSRNRKLLYVDRSANPMVGAEQSPGFLIQKPR